MQKSNLGRCRLWSGGGQKQQTREKRSMAKKSETQGFPTFSKVTDDDIVSLMTCLSWFQLYLQAGAGYQTNQIL